MSEELKRMTAVAMEGNLETGKVLGAMEVKMVLVKYKDGLNNKEETRLAIMIPGGEIYFFDNKAVDMRPAQKWLKDAVILKLSPKESDGSFFLPTADNAF